MDQLQPKHLDTSRGFRYTYYFSQPKADDAKPAILLCHGWPDSAHLWKEIVDHILKSKQRLIIPDLLVCGGSSRPTDPIDFEIGAMVADVMQVIQAEKIEQNIIPMGHDWSGSYFVTRFYLFNSARMAGLVTFNVALQPARSEPFGLAIANSMTEKAFGCPLYAYWELFADPKGPGEIMTKNPQSVCHAMHGASNDWRKTIFCLPGAIRE
ncbi:Bifunctional epoxide hydrolase 2 [Lecanosticta acicola]|uniref:Bifunctional epoxide hydrolase 2 n=1 Tax=Lecanosticta acicola TaxID=111012 RepID=A0AAI8Z0Y8_9PEZI|nr:Bifunctional epoxide hydrolase 2 [Lecanosticta acicola]